MGRSPRVLAIASGGGHWIQLQRLRPAFADCEVAFATVFPDYRDDVLGHRFYLVTDATRRSAWKIPLLALQIGRILLREKPDVVVTTGAAPGLVALAVAKTLPSARTMWIDSIANAERMSTSGQHARRFADVWLSQWPDVAGKEGAQFWGAVL
jgi:UDP-N-acetylglucosamine:LPS N-acetylglucosamine transferase